MSGQSEIHQKVTEAEYAATSGTGNATIHINNYYYRQETTVVSAKAADAEDASLPCPYRGLFHFGPGDAAYFFGRESVVETLVQATQTRHFIPLLGASGSGKSSVVLAGLVPKLQQLGRWQFTHFRPSEGDNGSNPFYALALALGPLYMPNLVGDDKLKETRKIAESLRNGIYPLSDVFAQIQHNFPQEQVLLIADQFEELYTLCTNEDTRRTFLDTLIAAFPRGEQSRGVGTGSPRLVLTMRADFLGSALSYRAFADVLQNADLKLGPMNRQELTDVVVKPAEKLGVTFEAELVDRILNDVEKEPGNLPLLEFALTELWQRRQGKVLTHVDYTKAGEVQEALARHADASYQKLSPAEQQQMRRVFIQLVRPGEGAEDTRRLATRAELGDTNWALVKQLADARLVVTNRSETAQVETVEVVHEALIRNWGELQGWMTADRTFRVWQDRLRAAMQQWQDTQKDKDSLLRGAALVEAEEKLKERPDDLNDAERKFIEQSLEERDRLKKAETDRRKAETDRRKAETDRRNLEITTERVKVGFVVATFVSSYFGPIVWNQIKRAELNQATSLGSDAQILSSQGKELDAFVQAIRAGKTLQKQRASDLEVIGALQEALSQRSEHNRFTGHQAPVLSVAITPDGKTLISGSADKTIKVWNLEKGGEPRTLTGHQDAVVSVAITPDGKTLISGSADKTIKVWNLEKGGEPRTLTGHQAPVLSVAITPDGKTLISGSADKTIKVWSFDLDTLMERSCDWVREYLKNSSSGVSEEDKHVCDGIGVGGRG